MYVWIDVSCLPSNVGPPAEKQRSYSLSERQAIAEDVAASDSEVVRIETEVQCSYGGKGWAGGRGGSNLAEIIFMFF